MAVPSEGGYQYYGSIRGAQFCARLPEKPPLKNSASCGFSVSYGNCHYPYLKTNVWYTRDVFMRTSSRASPVCMIAARPSTGTRVLSWPVFHSFFGNKYRLKMKKNRQGINLSYSACVKRNRFSAVSPK